jgi:phosphoglucosamine mutase
MEEFPQVIKSIPVKTKIPLEQLPKTSAAIEACQQALAGQGRTIVRYSGTEKKIRVLVESRNRADVDHWIKEICTAINAELT